MAINMDSKYNRFKADLPGGYFSSTTANPSSFDKKQVHRPVEPKKEDLPKGRPLFRMELGKNNPGPDNYDIKRNAEFEAVNLKKPCFFGHSYNHYRRTCDIERGVKVYDYAADKSNTDQYCPNVNYAKRRWPAFSQGKAKQFTLWEKQEKKSLVTPGPLSYNQDDKAIKPQRFNGVGLGLDIKCTQREIELTPGAGDYNTVQTGNDGNSFLKKTHNYFLENGGVTKPFLRRNPQEELIERAFLVDRKRSGKTRGASALSRKSREGYGQGASARVRDSSIIQ